MGLLSEKVVSVNLCRNPDIDFLGARMSEAFMECGIGDVHYCTTLNSKIDCRIPSSRVFHPFAASSCRQVFNLLPFARALFRNSSSGRLMLCSPSVLNAPVALWASYTGRKVMAAIHDVDPHYTGVRKWLYDLQNKVLIDNCSHLFVFSEHSERSIRHRLSTRTERRRENCTVVRLPLSSPAEAASGECAETHFGHGVSDHGSLDGERFDADQRHDFVWFGRNEPYKGVALLPEIAEKCADEGLTLLVISSFRDNEEPFAKLSELGNVTIVNGYVPDSELSRLIRSARVNLCPYLSATQSGIVSYASCLGVPSVVHRVGALPEQICEGVNGLIVDNILDVSLSEIVACARSMDAEKVKNYYRMTSSVDHLRSRITDSVK